MKYLWLCLLALWGVSPAMAQSPPTDTVYMSGLPGAGALSDTDQFYVCQDSVSHCPHGGANILAGTNTQLTTYFRSKFSATAPLSYNSSTGAFSFTGSITTVTKTGPYTITSADSGTCFDNFGASSIVSFTLPTLAAGLNFCFTVMTATAGTVGIEVLIPGGSGAKIALAPSVSAANGNIQDTTLYESVTLIAEPAGSPTTWVARSATGSNWIVN
jgi:hypothetical protein